jgi:hypothetical protein
MARFRGAPTARTNSIAISLRSHGAEDGQSSTSTGTSGSVRASPGWKTVWSPTVNR